jgi:hypothetical protein
MDTLAARKALLIARLRLQRMELALHAGAARETLRPASLVASARRAGRHIRGRGTAAGIEALRTVGAFCFGRFRSVAHRAHPPR